MPRHNVRQTSQTTTAPIRLQATTTTRAIHGCASASANPPTTTVSSAAEATQLLAGSGEVLSSARVPDLSPWLASATPAPAASTEGLSSPLGDSVAAARNAPAGTRATVWMRSQAESTPGILSATNSVTASAADVPSTHQDSVACRAGGSSTQPSRPARPTPNTVRYTRMPASQASRMPITNRWASVMTGAPAAKCAQAHTIGDDVTERYCPGWGQGRKMCHP